MFARYSQCASPLHGNHHGASLSNFIAGADGCHAGWVVVREGVSDGRLSWDVSRTLSDVFQGADALDVLALDIPIGLPAAGPRACDVEARSLLGPGRASSVFPAPIRPILAAASHSKASNARYATEGKRLSIQTWAIVPKIRDIDAFLRAEPTYRARVREVHPEVCFYFMAGRRPMLAAKKTPPGRAERLALLTDHFGKSVEKALADLKRLGCAADDLLDAFAGLWTARRVRAGIAVTIPRTPPCDDYGLPMEIVA